jgi:outer membrane protein OmpA-like peptidoglycan-associated protein
MCRRLVLVFIACVSVLLIRELTADACGVKLSIKAPRVKRSIERSANTSQILLLGDPPRSLSKELSGRGHKVEVAGSADEARRVRYHAIVADPEREEEAKTRWPGAVIVIRGGNARADANRVEEQLGSSPTRTLVARTPERTSRDERAPIRTGPPREDDRGAPVAAGGGDRTIAASGSGSVSAEASVSAPAPAPADTSADSADEPAPAKPAAREKRVAAIESTAAREIEAPAAEEADRAPARFSKRIFFGNSRAELSLRARNKLIRNARWLKRHEDRSVVVEGHASTTGPAAANMALSEARAQAVKDFLVENGVEESRIETKGFGLTKPEFRPGASPKNRRVIIRVPK